MIKEIVLVAITAITGTLDFKQDLKRYDDYLTKNYKTLRTTAQNICFGDSSYEDILQDNLIKIRNRISRSGFTSTSYESYDRSIYSFIWRGIDNDYKTKKKRDNRKTIYSIDNEHLQQDIHSHLENEDHDSQPYHDSMERFTRALFKYLDKHYDQKKSTLFKTYYMTQTNTYQKLAEQSGYQKKYIADIISKMKKDIKTNLPSYI